MTSEDAGRFSYSTTSPVEAAAVAEIFTNARRNRDIADFKVEATTFGDGVQIETECTLKIASYMNSEINEALRRIKKFGTTAIG